MKKKKEKNKKMKNSGKERIMMISCDRQQTVTQANRELVSQLMAWDLCL